MDKIALLRRIVSNFGSVELKAGPISMGPLARAQLGLGGLYGLKPAGATAHNDLAELMMRTNPRVARGVRFKELGDELFDYVLETLWDRDPESLTGADVSAMDRGIAKWFADGSRATTLYVPSLISQDRAPAFAVGPVRFLHLTDFRELYAPNLEEAEFDRLFKIMGERRAAWMGVIEVRDCHPVRAAEIGDIAVDLALTAVQMSIPPVNAPSLTRMDGRSLPPRSIRIAKVDERHTSSFTSSRTGRGIAAAELAKHLASRRKLLNSVGRRIRAFVTQKSPTPALEQSWADAAFWLREGIAEPLDTPAVPKLETALEVLLRAERSSGSERRIIRAITVFYGLAPDRTINTDTPITVKEFAKRLVSHRSRILHGTLSTLNEVMVASRSSLTTLGVELLGGFALALDRYHRAKQDADDVDAFLAWIEHTRAESLG